MEWNKFDPIGIDLLFQSCTISPEKMNDAKKIAYAMIVGEDHYVSVSRILKMPWFIVGAIHQMEAAGNFFRHIHNGDPLTERTIHAPAGRPVKPPESGSLPYSWEESACDALSGYPPHPPSWSVGHILNYLEAYNGLGYRNIGKPSPYVWSSTNVYERGKFTADGKFDPSVVSDQVGCAAMLKLLCDWKIIDLS